jgi:hemoglobin/transferrin/lactoferrin receptor protein
MNFYTLSPEFSQNNKTSYKLNSNLRYSSANNEKTFHSDFSIGQDKIALLSSVSISDFGDLRMGSHGPDDYLDEFIVFRENKEDKFRENRDPKIQNPTAYSQFSTLQKIKYRPSNDAFLTYGIYYSKLSDVPRYDRMVLRSSGLPNYGKWNYGPQKWFFQNIKFTTTKRNELYDQLAMVVGHQIYQESRLTRNYNESIENVRKEKLNIVSLNVDMKKAFKTWAFYYGMEGVYNDVQSNGVGVNVLNSETNRITSRYPTSDWFSYGIYFSTKKKLTKKFNFNAGARLNTFSIHSDFINSVLPLPFDKAKLNFSTISGNLGVVHKLSSRQTLNYVFSTGMRAPNVDDIGKIFDSAPGIVVVPNPDLKAERALNAEISYQYLKRENLSFETSIYYTHLNDAMVRRDFILNGQDSILYDGSISKVQSVQNAASAYVGGLQLGAEYNLNKNWTIRASYNFQKGKEEYDDGTRSNSRHVVPDFGRFSLKYDNPVWYFKTEFNYQSEMSFDDLPFSERDKSVIYASDKNGNPFAPSWWIMTIKGGYSFSDDFRLNIGVENVFDKRYRPYSSGISGSGLNFYAAINYSI